MKVIVYESTKAAPDTGGHKNVCVNTPVSQDRVDHCHKHDVPPGVTAYIIEHTELPAHHDYFFNAFKLEILEGKPKIAVHMPAAKIYAHARLMASSQAAHTQRAHRSAIGLENRYPDQEFTHRVVTARAAIEAAETPEHLLAALKWDI